MLRRFAIPCRAPGQEANRGLRQAHPRRSKDDKVEDGWLLRGDPGQRLREGLLAPQLPSGTFSWLCMHSQIGTETKTNPTLSYATCSELVYSVLLSLLAFVRECCRHW